MRIAATSALLLLSAMHCVAMAQGGAVANSNATNAEMTAMFVADQAVRQSGKIDWSVVGVDDRMRRVRTQMLLDAGKLSSADDFYHAAFVFQHGDRPDDYLKAHALAVVAAAKGKAEAAWIAAATLDRYLQSIGQPQIYGTQFTRHGSGSWTQEPYRRELLSDALREATGVPPIVKQSERLRDLEHQTP